MQSLNCILLHILQVDFSAIVAYSTILLENPSQAHTWTNPNIPNFSFWSQWILSSKFLVLKTSGFSEQLSTFRLFVWISELISLNNFPIFVSPTFILWPSWLHASFYDNNFLLPLHCQVKTLNLPIL